jgi:acetyl-CoA acetyltransferase
MSRSRQACIAGIGETAYRRRGQATDAEYSLALKAIVVAAGEAGIDPCEIDGLCTFADERSQPSNLAADLGIEELRYAAVSAIPGGGGGCAAIAEAATAVETGMADTVVAYRSICQGQFARIGRGMAPTTPQQPGAPLVPGALEAEAQRAFSAPFGVLGPSISFALRFRRHMELYGTTSEQLAHVAVTERAYTLANPRAVMTGRPMTIADHQESRIVADPYRLLDCCLETDGACAVIVTSADRAADLAQTPVGILSSAQGCDRGALGGAVVNAGSTADDYATGGASSVARRLYGRAGVTASDIDVAQLYDNFTGQVLLGLEDFGFCDRGASGEFVAAGGLTPAGPLPTNTSGGNLSEAYMQGLNQVIEAVRQIRGQSTSQVVDCELCLVTSSPGMPTSAIIVGSL